MELNQIKGECELDLVTDGAVEIKGSLRMEATAACLCSVSASVHLIDGYKSQQSCPDSQFREFDLVKDMAFLLHSLKPASILLSHSTLSYLEKQTRLPSPYPLMKFFCNYSFSCLVLITFPFTLNFDNTSQGFPSSFCPTLFTLPLLCCSPLPRHPQMLSLLRSSCQAMFKNPNYQHRFVLFCFVLLLK